MTHDVRLTVLGCAGTHPGPGRMCSSYLVETQGYRLLLDCGNGSLSNLQRQCDVADVDALLISHLHHDHFADVYGLYYALRFHPDGPRQLPIYAPAGAAAFIAQLLPDESALTFADRCPMHVAAAGDTLELGPLRVSLFAANHPIETLASRIEVDGRVIAFSGDSAPTDQLTACARDADIFLCDSTWLDRAGPWPDGVHMTGRQAGRQATEAGAARLVVTHVVPSIDANEVAAEAADAHNGEVVLAVDMLELRV